MQQIDIKHKNNVIKRRSFLTDIRRDFLDADFVTGIV